MDLRKIIQDSLDEKFDSGLVNVVINEQVEKTIRNAIEDQFRSYGSMGNKISDAIKDSMKLDLDKFNLDSYNITITNMVQKLALEHLESKAANTIKDRLDELLSPAPDNMTVQEIVNNFIDIWKDTGNFSICPHISIENSDWSELSTNIKLYSDYSSHRTSSYSQDLAMDIHIYKNKILIPRLNSNVFTSKHMFDGECFIYQLAASGTSITDAHTVSDQDIIIDLN